VFLADLATGKPVSLRAGTGTESYGYPAISGNKVVWLRHRGVNTRDEAQYSQTPYDICGADVTNPAAPLYFTVAEKVGRCPPYPYSEFYYAHDDIIDISGDLVVWEGNGDIFGADISDLSHIKVFPICTAAERQYDPAISGHRVVWTDERDDLGDICGADISDPNNIREFKVCAEPGWQLQPDIDGALIAFTDGDDRSGYIRACCISREYGVVQFTLPRPDGDYYSFFGARPKVDGTTIIWQDYEQVQGISLESAYGLTGGPVENLTTGVHYDHIQHAVDAATAGDVVVAQEGTYQEKLCFRGKGVTVTSANPQNRQTRAATVIAGGGQIVTFADGEDSNSVLTGFTISGGGFGVYCSASTPLISDCVITGNAFAGIKLWDLVHPTVAYSEITDNGTGVEMWEIRAGRFIRRSDIMLQNCIIAGSRKDGIWGGRPTIQNCTIADNLGYGISSFVLKASSSIVYFNHQGGQNLKVDSPLSTVAYSDVQGGWTGEGNIDADPLFVAQGQWNGSGEPGTAWVPGDYHLKSEGWTWDVQQNTWTSYDATSPCIDMGDAALPLGDEPMCSEGSPLSERAGPNQRIDMGAYGGTAEASPAPR
jgi:beta propeller repeat protein